MHAMVTRPSHLSQSFVSLAWHWNVALSGPDTLPGLTWQSDGEYLYRIPWNLPYVSHYDPGESAGYGIYCPIPGHKAPQIGIGYASCGLVILAKGRYSDSEWVN